MPTTRIKSRRWPSRPPDDGRGTAARESVRGTLPSFAKPIGLDFIITEEERVYLVELQHGFGRKGFRILWPELTRHYRKTKWRLRRELGKCWEVSDGLRKICHDKIQTYKRFSELQPRSFVYRKWGPKVEAWLDSLESEFILAKPPLGSCGEGIIVFEREAFRRAAGDVQLGHANLLQEYVESRLLPGPDGGEHIGCIRQILILISDGNRLTFMHMAPYWRVAPSPLERDAASGTMTANISRGAFALPVSEADAALTRPIAERLGAALISEILELPDLKVEPGVILKLEE